MSKFAVEKQADGLRSLPKTDFSATAG